MPYVAPQVKSEPSLSLEDDKLLESCVLEAAMKSSEKEIEKEKKGKDYVSSGHKREGVAGAINRKRVTAVGGYE